MWYETFFLSNLKSVLKVIQKPTLIEILDWNETHINPSLKHCLLFTSPLVRNSFEYRLIIMQLLTIRSNGQVGKVVGKKCGCLSVVVVVVKRKVGGSRLQRWNCNFFQFFFYFFFAFPVFSHHPKYAVKVSWWQNQWFKSYCNFQNRNFFWDVGEITYKWILMKRQKFLTFLH